MHCWPLKLGTPSVKEHGIYLLEYTSLRPDEDYCLCVHVAEGENFLLASYWVDQVHCYQVKGVKKYNARTIASDPASSGDGIVTVLWYLTVTSFSIVQWMFFSICVFWPQL